MKNLFFIIIFTILFLGCSKSSDNEPENTINITVANFTISIPENPQSGTVIGTINASVNNGSLSFSITEQSPSNAVAIDASSGELRVNNAEAFDFETNNSISGTVKVSQGTQFETASFAITLEDVFENVFEGDVYLRNQEEVNAFGANNYTEVTGELKIGETGNEPNNIVDLTPLKSIIKVGDDLEVRYTQLVSLVGLDNINYVGQDLRIDTNNYLEDISSLNQITDSLWYLSLRYLPLLTNLSGLQNITNLRFGIDISYTGLINLDELSNLTNIEIDGGIGIRENPNLVSIEGLSNIQSGFYSVSILDNNQLQSLNGLQSLNPVVYSLGIGDNEMLSDLSALSHITEIGSFGIGGNPLITNLDDFESLNLISEGFSLKDNESLENIDVFCNVNFDLYSIYIDGNPVLQSLSCLQNLTHIGDQLFIWNNPSITSLDGLQNLKTVGPGQGVLILDNEQLSDFCALTLLSMSTEEFNYTVGDNAYNPNLNDIANGDCSL